MHFLCKCLIFSSLQKATFWGILERFGKKGCLGVFAYVYVRATRVI